MAAHQAGATLVWPALRRRPKILQEALARGFTTWTVPTLEPYVFKSIATGASGAETLEEAEPPLPPSRLPGPPMWA